MPYFGDPVGRVNYKQRVKILILSNTPNCYFRGGELREYLFTGECVTEVQYAKRNEIGARNPAN